MRGVRRGQSVNRQDAKAPRIAEPTGIGQDRGTGSGHRDLGVLAFHQAAKAAPTDNLLARGRCRRGASVKEIPTAIALISPVANLVRRRSQVHIQ